VLREQYTLASASQPKTILEGVSEADKMVVTQLYNAIETEEKQKNKLKIMYFLNPHLDTILFPIQNIVL